MKLYRFMQDRKWYEDALHILVGLVPMWGWIREHRQLPPENDRYPVIYIDLKADEGTDAWAYRLKSVEGNESFFDEYWAATRVHDIFRDNLGYSIGATLRTAVLVGLLIWKWLA